MAVRKTLPKPEPQTPLETYGCRITGKSQLFYWRYAFWRKLPIDSGAPTRDKLFKLIADKIVPNWFEWHTWTNNMVSALCNYQWVGLAGCAGCVSGDTRILNPLTGEQPTIKDLVEKQIAPVVMTLDGPVQAEIPFVKGVEELIRVNLEDGSSFCVTGEHRVLTPQGFSYAKSLSLGQPLFSYAPILRESTSDTCLGVHGQDVPCFPRKEQDCLDRCCSCYHPYDEQLLLARDACQLTSPLQGDVQGHIHLNYNKDDLAKEVEHIREIPSFHHSKKDTDFHRSWLDRTFLFPLYLRIALPVYHWFRRFLLFLLRICFQEPSLSPNHDCVHKHSVVGAVNWKDGSVVRKYNLQIAQSKIASICAIGKQTYYDITVPSTEHYFAEGAIHHNSAKTRNVAGFACTWWMCNPEESSVIFCSTTVKSLRKRGWAEVQNYHTSIPGPRIGNFVDSRMMWQAVKGDDKHAIVGIAVEEGGTTKVADNIKGIHTKRQMIIIDEATAIPTAIFDAATNMYSYPEEFMMVVIGNPRSRLDEMGKFCEPVNGWNTVSVDTEEWDTKPQLNGKNGVVIRFDAEKSPNIVEGKLVSKHLPTKEKVEARRKALSSENDPTYWSNDRGFWPPEGTVKTIFSETAINKHNGTGKHTFSGNNFQIIGAFDPARIGGDRRVLRFAALGELEGKSWGLEWMNPIIVPVNAKSSNPIDYQIVDQVRRECERVTWRGQVYSCLPENLGIDATGGGADLCDIFERMWSPKIIRIVFSGSASEDSCSLEDVRPANEVYRNKRAEMYFRSRNALNSEQLKGIDNETAKELCSIEFDDSKPLITLISKSDYKVLFGKSPDLADSGVMLLEVARRKGFRLTAIGQTVNRSNEWNQLVEKTQSVYEDAKYADEEVDYEDVFV